MKKYQAWVWSVIAVFASVPAAAQTIDWEVVNRFRVFDNERLHNAYIARIQCLARNKCKPKVKGDFSALIEPRPNDHALGTALNFHTRWNEAQEQYDIAWIHDPRRRIRVETAGVPKGSRCLWKQDGKEIAGAGCSDRVVEVAVGKTSTVTVEIQNGRKPIKQLETTIAPKDIFIAAVGDSYLSGESNPHLARVSAERGPGATPEGYPAIWWDTRCHRSMVSAAVQAAALLAERHRDSSVTFVSYACSGAEIDDGVLTKFEGRETVQQVTDLWKETGHSPPPLDFTAVTGKAVAHELKPQVDRLQDVLCPTQSRWKAETNCDAASKKRPDILIIAVGGNDIGFGEIGRQILLSDPKTSDKKTRDDWLEASKKKLLPLFDTLDTNYSRLAAAIRSQINPRLTMLMEYMDPTRYRAGRSPDGYCGKDKSHFKRYGADGKEYSKYVKPKDQSGFSFAKNSGLYNLLISRDEAELAQWVVYELNGRVKNAAGRSWNGEDKNAEVFRLQDLKGPDGAPRGICASSSWFTGIFQSWNRQGWIPADPAHKYALKLTKKHCPHPLEDDECRVEAGNVTSGVLHPNFFGHYNMGSRMLSQMEKGIGR